MRSLEELAEKTNYALVIGIGGGGDVVGTLPTSNYLRRLGLKTTVGGLTWERYVIDPEPGPRKMEEITNIKLLSPTVGLANPQTNTTKGIRFTESIVAEVLREETLLIDLNRGVEGVVSGLEQAALELGADLFIGIDVGGDVIAEGTEEGLRSMLADSMMLAAMNELGIPSVLGVLGFGTDGELSFERLSQQVALAASYGGLLGARGLTPEDVELLERVIPRTKTEATALAVQAARGKMGEVEIRCGRRKVLLTPMSAMTIYFDPRVIFERVNKIARELAGTKSLDEAQSVLERLGLTSELTFERDYMRKRAKDPIGGP